METGSVTTAIRVIGTPQCAPVQLQARGFELRTRHRPAPLRVIVAAIGKRRVAGAPRPTYKEVSLEDK